MDKEQAVGEDYHHHMQIPWQDFVEDDNVTPAKEAPLVERSMIVGRVGLMILACGTGSWRVGGPVKEGCRDPGKNRLARYCFGLIV